HGRDDGVDALDQIRPPALNTVSTSIGVGRRSYLLEFADGARLAQSHRLLKQGFVGYGVVSLRIRHLTGADEGGKQIGPRLRHEDAENRSPGMADENDLVRVHGAAEHLGELDSVLSHAFDRDRRRYRRPALSERSAGAAL